MKLGFIGTGAITEAIVRGLLASAYECEAIILSARNAERASRLAALDSRVRVEADNQRIVDLSDWVFIAVRPQVVEDVLRPLSFRPDQPVASLVATVQAEQLQAWIQTPVRITRSIPLPAVAQRSGATVVYPPDEALAELYAQLGTVVEAQSIDEFDAYAAASSLMGTYFGVMESASAWLGEQGGSSAGARRYLSQVFLELARTAEREADSSFSELRVEHSTPGGLNQQLHEVFTHAGGSEALQQGLNSVVGRIRDARSGNQ